MKVDRADKVDGGEVEFSGDEEENGALLEAAGGVDGGEVESVKGDGRVRRMGADTLDEGWRHVSMLTDVTCPGVFACRSDVGECNRRAKGRISQLALDTGSLFTPWT